MATGDVFRRAVESGGVTRLREKVQNLVDQGVERDSIHLELTRLLETFEEHGRSELADATRDVIAMLSGWSSPDAVIVRRALGGVVGTFVSVGSQVLRADTTARVWTDRNWAASVREQLFPLTVTDQPYVAVLDLVGVLATPAVLEELLLPVAMGIRAGAYGQMSLVVYTHDRATAGFIEALASRFEVPIFVGVTKRWLDVPEIWPAGELTGTERETLAVLATHDGAVTASELGDILAISSTAAGNRLARLSEKSWVFRFRGSGTVGDVFVDPRVSAPNPRDVGLSARVIKHIDVASHTRGEKEVPPTPVVRRGGKAGAKARKSVAVGGREAHER
jgi:hypothetical protein